MSVYIYLGNKMLGKPEFNFPWFFQAEEKVREIPGITDVFNPARRDQDFGFNTAGMAGTEDDMFEAKFSRRVALTADWSWIGTHSSILVLGPDWRSSTGTISEIACHQALGLPVYTLEDFLFWSKKVGIEEVSLGLNTLAVLRPILELGVE